MKVVDGNTACATMAYLLSEESFIYPITPSSPMASLMDKMSSEGGLNIFNDTTSVIEMQSEAGAAGSLHGALSAGILASTFTASQGLLLMIPNMYKMAGEMLPAVIHVASRSLATHALSIFGDHQDIYATRQTGFSILASTNVQDAYNLALIAHVSAIKASIPFLHFFDGFRTSHEFNQINNINLDFIKNMCDYEAVDKFRKRALNSGVAITKGTAQNEDIYFQSVEARNKDYDNIPDIVNSYMEKLNKEINSDYKPFNYYGSDNAKHVIVAMGSVCDTVKTVIEELNQKENIYGLIEVHLYRPFSKKYLLNVLPKSVENIAVLDRTKEPGSIGEPLYLDILSSLKDSNKNIYGGRYGLSSKNTTPNDIYDVFMMLKTKPVNNFTIGITDDLTFLSLPKNNYQFRNNFREFKIYGFGSDGMVSASKEIIKILGESNCVQGYSEYDSKKSGGVTISHLRLSDKLIKAPYYVTEPELIVVTKDEYFHKFNIIENLKENGTLLINTQYNEEKLNIFLPTKVKKLLLYKNAKVYIINAEKIALNNNIKGKISLIMEANILKLLNINNYTEILNKTVSERFATKGLDIVNANIKSIDDSKTALTLIEINNSEGFDIKQDNDIFGIINSRQGDSLTVKDLLPYKDGTFPGGTSANEKRKMSTLVPKWDKNKCIECGFCAMVCPHAVIRPFLTDKTNKYHDEAKKSITPDKDFIISVSEADCTSCGLCLSICPSKCLSYGQYDDNKQQMANDLFSNYKNEEMPLNSLKNIAFRQPLFEFSGACAGCGETPYLRLLTQIVGEKLVIANATGCSSIYGASCPSTPYKVSWGNSLFEDNAEYGYGILLSYKKMQNRIKNQLQNHPELLIKYEEYANDFNKMQIIKRDIEKVISPELSSYILPKSVWTIGGDGWAYDIGFGGLDHVLSSNENVRILVLDTEVYSNTGGQSSKSTRTGAIAEFANFGKKTGKKDLFRIAMSYPDIYVASVCFGANMMHTINVFKEAESHIGPSLIIAYSPCVEQGIKNGMVNAVAQQKLAVESGYVLLMRYFNKQLKLDSNEPNFNKYNEFLNNEVRYNALRIKDKKIADELLNINKASAIEKYDYYKNLANK